MLQFTIHGKPIPWAAAKAGRHCHYDIRSKDKQYVRWQLKSQYRDSLISHSVFVHFLFLIPIPKSTSKIRKREMLCHRILPHTKPDTTNLQKLYEDCLKGVVISDDNQCVDIFSQRRFSENPGIVIKIFDMQQERPALIISPYAKQE